MTVTLDGADRWSDTFFKHHLRLCRIKNVRMQAAVISDELLRILRLADGIIINYKIYCQLVEVTFFKHWYKKRQQLLKRL